MKGVPADKEIIYRWVDERLKLWQTDYFDILMLTNSEERHAAVGLLGHVVLARGPRRS